MEVDEPDVNLEQTGKLAHHVSEEPLFLPLWGKRLLFVIGVSGRSAKQE
jgi:hypothetical protein